MIKLLFVDDEKGITDLLHRFFSRHGFTTQSANTAEDALKIIKTDKPDIVFLDIRIEHVNGLDVLKKIKEFDKGIKVIMLTIIEDKSTVEEARDLGADEYITKPFRISYLEEVVVKKIQELMKGKKP